MHIRAIAAALFTAISAHADWITVPWSPVFVPPVNASTVSATNTVTEAPAATAGTQRLYLTAQPSALLPSRTATAGSAIVNATGTVTRAEASTASNRVTYLSVSVSTNTLPATNQPIAIASATKQAPTTLTQLGTIRNGDIAILEANTLTTNDLIVVTLGAGITNLPSVFFATATAPHATNTITLSAVIGTATNALATFSGDAPVAAAIPPFWLGDADRLLITAGPTVTNLPTVSLTWLPSPTTTNLLTLSDTDQWIIRDMRPLQLAPSAATNAVAFSVSFGGLPSVQQASWTNSASWSPASPLYLIGGDTLSLTATRVTNRVPFRAVTDRQRN